MKKIAIFLGDFFWSSIPYDGVRLQKILLSQGIETDFLMFEKDIRLNKKFNGKEKFKFETQIFQNLPNLKILSNWKDLITISKNYKTIISSTHIAPKTRYPNAVSLKNEAACPLSVWDIGGADILTNAKFAHFYFVKGPIWKNFINEIDEKNEAFVTGSPHYDEYVISNFNEEKKKAFFKKYQLEFDSKCILVCPTNPGSHTEQFNQNLHELETLIKLSLDKNVKVLLKTYPGDYLFYEDQFQFSGVYKRTMSNKPQYEFLKEKFPQLIVIESQDHFDAIMFCKAIFNMSGSHISWETHFSQAKSYSINYKNKSYYKSVKYLKNVVYPDDIYNKNVETIEQIFSLEKNEIIDNDYIISTDANNNIAKLICDNTLRIF